jgi:hypothetical protein
MKTMNHSDIRSIEGCPHSDLEQPEGLAVIAIGNAQPRRFGNLNNVISQPTLENVCKFKVRANAEDLATYLKGHKAAIIIDSGTNSDEPGTISLIDLGAMLSKNTLVKINTRHGYYLTRQLRQLKKSGQLPARIIFFGVENGDSHPTHNNKNNHPSTSQSPKTLTLLINKAAQALKQHA